MNLTNLQGYALSKLLYKAIIKELNFVLFPFRILVQTCLCKTTYEYVKRIVEYKQVGPRRITVYSVYCCDFYDNKI